MGSVHAEFAPSAAHRWMNCPASVPMSRDAPPDKGSEHAAEGSVAHKVADRLVTGTMDELELLELVGTTLDHEKFTIKITEEMVDGAVLYRDTVAADLRELGKQGRPAGVGHVSETRVRASVIDKDLWGTADFLLWQNGNVLYVYDYKFGKGVPVEAEENEQMLIYALGAMEKIGCRAYDRIELVIVQPRAPHADGPVRRWPVQSLI